MAVVPDRVGGARLMPMFDGTADRICMDVLLSPLQVEVRRDDRDGEEQDQ